MSTKTDAVEVELDSRQRLPLARIVRGDQHRFRVEKLPGGELLLTPVVSVSERELAFLSDPEAVARVRRGLEQAAAGQVTRYPPGYFQKLTAELGDDEQ